MIVQKKTFDSCSQRSFLLIRKPINDWYLIEYLIRRFFNGFFGFTGGLLYFFEGLLSVLDDWVYCGEGLFDSL